MSGSRGKGLTEEDRILWDLVARSVKPSAAAAMRLPSQMKLVQQVVPAAPEPEKSAPARLASIPAYQSAAPKIPTGGRAHLDTQTLEKLAKGRLQLEARVDLHGMRQDEAYGLLLSFVARAHARGARYVLVITGKGSSTGGDGVLRRSVPGWLSTQPFKPYVSAHETAARGHGGLGALYLRLKRTRSG